MSVLPVGFGASGGYTIDRSLRFRSSASAYLNRTPASAGNQKTWTWSGWVKRGASGTLQFLFSAGTSGVTYHDMYINSDDTLRIVANIGSTPIKYTTQVFRDFGAWYHFINVFDTTNATADDRMRLYVNGVRITSFGTSTNPALNADGLINSTSYQHAIGRRVFSSSNHFDGYLTEINFIDGQALDPTYFGEYNDDTGVWQPKKYTGTYGTNGFYLNFSDNSSTTTLGEDGSGNGNDWTLNNFSLTSGSTYDSMTDVPTLTSETAANYATLNPLDNYNTGATISDGNLKWTIGAADGASRSTIGMSAGKYYAEVNGTMDYIGVVGNNAGITNMLGTPTIYYMSNGQKRINGSLTSYGATYSNSNTMGIAIDVDGGTVTFYKDNVSQGAISLSSSGTPSEWMFAIGSGSGSTSGTFNFGQQPFAYTPPTGFKALNTYNLPDSTIEDGSKYMSPLLYVSGGGAQTVTGLEFQPDMVWVKIRGTIQEPSITDSVRGVNSQLRPANTAAQSTYTDCLTSFNSDGFSLGADATNHSYNYYSGSAVAWNWKANGSGSSNTDGSITSTVSANTTSGFSIVTYTGNNTSGATIGHGLGIKPSFLVVKKRTGTDGWGIYHTSLGATKTMELNTTAGQTTTAIPWNNTEPTSSVIYLNGNNYANSSLYTYVMYCFAEVEGFSKMGVYSGNSDPDGTFVYTGFKVAWVLIKGTGSGGSGWLLYDTERRVYNVNTLDLRADLANQEPVSSGPIDFLSNGFKLRGTDTNSNSSSTSYGPYIYMAFAENPFKNSLAR